MVRTRLKRDKRGYKTSLGDGRNKGATERYAVRALRSVIDNEEASATARVQAARTLAEMEGQIGRHQAAPSRSAEQPLSALSRDQLAQELDRLRALVSLGLVPEP